MNILIIIASVAIGMVVGMGFMACFNAEMRKHDHEQLRKANARNVYLSKKIHEIKTQLAVQPAVDKKVIELLDFSDPYQDVNFGGF